MYLNEPAAVTFCIIFTSYPFFTFLISFTYFGGGGEGAWTAGGLHWFALVYTCILEAVVRIRDVCAGSQIRIILSRIPDLGQKDSGSRIWIRFKEFNYVFLTQKIVSKLPEIWFGAGSRIQGSKRPRIADLDPQHCLDVEGCFAMRRQTEEAWLGFLGA